MKDLFAEYGQRSIEAEIANGRLQECKQRVAAALQEQQKQKPVEVTTTETK
jgi:hypothetical protein